MTPLSTTPKAMGVSSVSQQIQSGQPLAVDSAYLSMRLPLNISEPSQNVHAALDLNSLLKGHTGTLQVLYQNGPEASRHLTVLHGNAPFFALVSGYAPSNAVPHGSLEAGMTPGQVVAQIVGEVLSKASGDQSVEAALAAAHQELSLWTVKHGFSKSLLAKLPGVEIAVVKLGTTEHQIALSSGAQLYWTDRALEEGGQVFSPVPAKGRLTAHGEAIRGLTVQRLRSDQVSALFIATDSLFHSLTQFEAHAAARGVLKNQGGKGLQDLHEMTRSDESSAVQSEMGAIALYGIAASKSAWFRRRSA